MGEPTTSHTPTNIFLVGVGGFGAVHLANILRLQDAGQVKLTALIDPTVTAKVDATTGQKTYNGYPLFNTLRDTVPHVSAPHIVVIAVPIHLHYPIASEVMMMGADVLLEKPACSRFADFTALMELEKKTGRTIQIGFQSMGSLALDVLVNPAQLNIGTVRAIRARGLWHRPKWYWERNHWAGRRTIGETDVMDGVTTNAFAHATMTALYIAGAHDVRDIDKLEVETYRANKVDIDDTTCLRIKLSNGIVFTGAYTLCHSDQKEPVIDVVGTHGQVSFNYVRDELITQTPDGPVAKIYGRDNLLENLLAFRRDGTPLRCPLAATGPFMRVLEEIRTGKQPVHIDSRWTELIGEGQNECVVVKDLESWIDTATGSDSLFSEAGAPWAFTKTDGTLARAEIGGKTVFEVLDGLGTIPSSSPRPYVHPIRTLSGVEVTATRPADHDWHMGLGFPIPDVNGVTFWGGPTYVRDKGYIPLDNYGTITTEDLKYIAGESSTGTAGSPVGLDMSLAWLDTKGQPLLRERRQLRWSPLEIGSKSGWQLDYQSSLTALEQPLSLGGPGTNGRVNAGYGGFFIRLPRCSNISIISATAEGEDAVHGSVSPWIAWSSRFESRPGAVGDATIVIVPGDSVTAADPWFVRETGYPGIGSAIAWENRVEIPAGQTIGRRFHCAIFDGRLDRDVVAELAGGMSRQIDEK